MSLVGFSVIIHGTMNSIIFLAINIEVLDCFLELEDERSGEKRDLLGCTHIEVAWKNFPGTDLGDFRCETFLGSIPHIGLIQCLCTG